MLSWRALLATMVAGTGIWYVLSIARWQRQAAAFRDDEDARRRAEFESAENRKWWASLRELPDELQALEKRLLELEGSLQDYGRGQAVTDGLLLKPLPFSPAKNSYYKVITRTFLSASGGSTSEGAFTPEMAIDEDRGTRMACESCHWTGDLGRMMNLVAVNIDWESCQCSQETAGKIEVSTSGSSWQPFATIGSMSAFGGHTSRRYIGLAEARFVRVSMTGSATWFSIWEVSASVEAEAQTQAETLVETKVEVGGAPVPAPANAKKDSSATKEAPSPPAVSVSPTSAPAAVAAPSGGTPGPQPPPAPPAPATAAPPVAGTSGAAGNSEDAAVSAPAASSDKSRFRRDNKCGKRTAPLEDGSPVECDPVGEYPCCSRLGWCGRTMDHCACKPGCVDYREKYKNPLPTVGASDTSKEGSTVVVTIPFRDRETHLVKFKKFWRWFAKEGQKPPTVTKWEIYIAEQFDTTAFNRGWNFNVGLAVASQQKSASEDITPQMGVNFDCAVIQDIDYLPEEGVDYSACEVPIQLSSEIDRYDGKVPYLRSAGGIVGMSLQHWQQINGFSNDYFGWGGEDDELFHRLRLTGLLHGDCYPFCRIGDVTKGRPGLSIKRPSKGHGRFSGKYMHSANHTKRITDNKAYEHNLKLLGQIELGNDRWMRDGLSNIAFRIVTYEVDTSDQSEYGITYHHVKVRRGRKSYAVKDINVAAPYGLCPGSKKQGAVIKQLGDPMPWDLEALKGRVQQMLLDASSSGGCSGAPRPSSFIVVDRRSHLAKIVSDQNSGQLVAFYRSLDVPSTDGLIIADARSPDQIRASFMKSGEFIYPPMAYTICTSQMGKSELKYSVHEGHSCGGGWKRLNYPQASFWAFSKQMGDGSTSNSLTYCDNPQHWVQKLVQGEACPKLWEGLKWNIGQTLYVAKGDQYCVHSGKSSHGVPFSKVEPRIAASCKSEDGFTFEFGFSGLDNMHLFRSFTICISRSSTGGHQTRVGAEEVWCEGTGAEGWRKMMSFRAFIEAAEEPASATFCVKRTDKGDEIRPKGKCGSDLAFKFSLPAWTQAEVVEHGRIKVCAGQARGDTSTGFLVGIGEECGTLVDEELSFYAPTLADVASSTPGSDNTKIPMYTLVEEEVPCNAFFCKHVVHCAQKYSEEACSLTQAV